jgi:hypothetical protein
MPRLIDLSHTVEDGMITYKGLPPPIVCDFLSREASRARYAAGVEFHIGKIEMVANTGTYLDSPFHRYADGKDLSQLDLAILAEREGVVARLTGPPERAISSGDLLVLAGADHAACATYIEQALVPSLRPGQVVIMDRLNVHTGASIRASIEASGCELRLLPAYSPDFNPIEQAFAKIKTHLRSAEARTFPALVRAIGTALDRITTADACHC